VVAVAINIKDQLMEDLKVAMREKDVIRKNAVQLTRSAILQIEKDKQIVLDEAGVMEVIAKEVKKRKDSLPEFEKAQRQDLVDNLNREIEVLSAYLPAQLSDEELEAIVKEQIEKLGATSMKDMGKVMSALKEEVGSRADGGRINAMVKTVLGG
jgi:hypothetical protein